jgi:hypothetical protein
MGPFAVDAVVVPSLAHNVKPFAAPDGTWLVYYVGEINNGTGALFELADRFSTEALTCGCLLL